MIVAKSTVDLAAQHASSSRSELSETLRAWIGAARPDFESLEKGTTASISAAALAALQAHPPAPPLPPPAPGAAGSEAQAIDAALAQADQDPILYLIRLMVEMLSGHKVARLALKIGPAAAPAGTPQSAPQSPAPQPAAGAAPSRAGYGVEYDRHQVRSEVERTDIQASGAVLTADGRQIAFKLALSMQRSYREESGSSLRLGDAVQKDPLVINFGRDAVKLEGQRFSFKLDASGATDRLPLLASGSGFLALDLNQNGLIDSGKELFGAASGKGFADLAAYDSDGNGWIDENDPVFNRLRIWTPAADGGSLTGLRDKNVGALGLASTASPFALRDGANQSLGTVRATGVYLREDGSSGTLQQVDLTV